MSKQNLNGKLEKWRSLENRKEILNVIKKCGLEILRRVKQEQKIRGKKRV
jgi:hypothetical protein